MRMNALGNGSLWLALCLTSGYAATPRHTIDFKVNAPPIFWGVLWPLLRVSSCHQKYHN
jgi:hypothetical protein